MHVLKKFLLSRHHQFCQKLKVAEYPKLLDTQAYLQEEGRSILNKPRQILFTNKAWAHVMIIN